MILINYNLKKMILINHNLVWKICNDNIFELKQNN